MTIFRWRCWLRELALALRHPLTIARISGHDYRVEVPEGVQANTIGQFAAVVTLLRCEDCGDLDIGWEPTSIGPAAGLTTPLVSKE